MTNGERLLHNQGGNALGRLIDYSPGMGSVIMALGCTSPVTPTPVSEILEASATSVTLLNEVESGYGTGFVSDLRIFTGAEAEGGNHSDLVDFIEQPRKLQAKGRLIGEARKAAPADFDWSL